MTFRSCQYVASSIPVSGLIVIENAMRSLGVSRSTLYRLIKTKILPQPIVIHGRIRGWRTEDFIQFIETL